MAKVAEYLKEKLEITKRAYDLSTVDELCEALYPEGHFEDPSDREKALQRLLKYLGNAGTSTSDTELFVRLKWLLRINKTIHEIKQSTLDEFVRSIGDGPRRIHAERVLKSMREASPAVFELQGTANGGSATADDNQEPSDYGGQRARIDLPVQGWHLLHVDVDYLRHDIINEIHQGQVDQKFLYLDRLSALRWRALTLATHRYKTYRYCCETLEDFIASGEDWQTPIKDGKFSSVFMLGAGSPQKDMVILDSFVHQMAYHAKNKLNYVLVDTSMNMILQTVIGLQDDAHSKYRSCVNPIAICSDFMNLTHIENRINDEAQAILRPDDKNVAYFIPGPTISNINETLFMESVRAVAHPGDLLIIAAEFIDETDPEGYEAKLKRNYDNKELRDLVILPVFWALSPKERNDAIADLNAFVDVSVEKKSWHRFLKRRWTVKITANIEGRRVVLATSNRYWEAEFIAFISSFGFRPVKLFPHREEPQYKQAVFCREKE